MTVKFLSLLDKYNWLIYYLLIINIVTFATFAIDKIAAIRHKTRIKVATLLGLSFVGGSIGALIGMYLLRHKTKKILLYYRSSTDVNNANSRNLLFDECKITIKCLDVLKDF